MAIYRGQNVRIDYGDLELTDDLEEALETLASECSGGCGGTWEIFKEDGGTWRAVFLDMATDELVWDADEGSWTDDYSDEDEDEDDEEYMAAFVA